MSIISLSHSHSQDQKPSNSYSFKTLVTDSFKIFSRNKHVYFLIFTLLTLPLSFLHFHLSLSSYPLKSQILHLEYLASRAPTRFEARQVWRESREIVLSLLHTKLWFFVPIYTLSLVAAIAVSTTAESRYHGKPTSIAICVAAFSPNWTRRLVTTMCIYVILILYSTILYVFSIIIRTSWIKLRFVIWFFGMAIEVFIMGVLALGLVVSVLEKRFGFDAIRTGYGLMEGRRVTGWLLSGLLAVVTGGIGWRMEGLVEEGTAGGSLEWAVLIGVYAVVVICGFVVFTVFYCECRKRHVVRVEEEEEEMVNEENPCIEVGS